MPLHCNFKTTFSITHGFGLFRVILIWCKIDDLLNYTTIQISFVQMKATRHRQRRKLFLKTKFDAINAGYVP